MDVRALPPGYTEWAPPAALRDAVACLWAQVNDSSAERAGLVLPDGCTDLVWEQGRGAFVAGPDTGPVPTTMPGGTIILGARFRPSAGGPALGLPVGFGGEGPGGAGRLGSAHVSRGSRHGLTPAHSAGTGPRRRRRGSG